MNHGSYITATPIQGSRALDFEAWLALQMIQKGAAENDTEFFVSDWYLDILAYLSYFFPDFDPQDFVLPVGVVIK